MSKLDLQYTKFKNEKKDIYVWQKKEDRYAEREREKRKEREEMVKKGVRDAETNICYARTQNKNVSVPSSKQTINARNIH